jgi:hypothetical protein
MGEAMLEALKRAGMAAPKTAAKPASKPAAKMRRHNLVAIAKLEAPLPLRKAGLSYLVLVHFPAS